MPKKVAAIHDLSGLGKCSLTAVIPTLSALGVQACPIPTAILTSQTGYNTYYCDDYTDKMDYFTEQWKRLGVTIDGIYTGYLASAAQVEKIEAFMEAFEKDEPFILVDPVMADQGVIYPTYDDALVEGVKRLTKRAHVITPNVSELCVLTGENYETLTEQKQTVGYLEKVAEIAKKLVTDRLKTVVVTGVSHRYQDGACSRIANIVVTKDQVENFCVPEIPENFSGTGDLFASVVCACMVQGKTAQEAVRLATEFLCMSIQGTVEKAYDPCAGVSFENYLYILTKELHQ